MATMPAMAPPGSSSTEVVPVRDHTPIRNYLLSRRATEPSARRIVSPVSPFDLLASMPPQLAFPPHRFGYMGVR